MKCVKCGKEGALPSMLCPSCLFEQLKPISLPEKLEIVVCGDCSAVLIGKHWEKFKNEIEGVKKLIAHNLKCAHGFKCLGLEVLIEEIDRSAFSANVVLRLSYEGAEICYTKRIPIFRKRNVCPDCSRFHGHAYSAIIQIRRKGRRIAKEVLNEIEKILSEKSGGKREIVKREDVENGIDFYIADNSYARSVCNLLKQKFKARVKVSPKLHTRREGRDVYRITYLVELDRFEEGDLIYHNGELYYASSVEQGKVFLRSAQGLERVVEEDLLKNAEIIGLDMLEEMKVVYCNQNEVCLLDERTMRLERFENIDYPQEAENAWVLKREDRIYLVPLRIVMRMRKAP